jgi:LacI family transcriptional regulator
MATIRDVAEAAGVSPMAVSKVLHGKGDTVRVSKDKAALIRQIAADLRYQPNHLARSFRSKRTYTVGMIFEHFQRVGDRTGYFSQLLNGVMSATFSNDYGLTICPKLIRDSASGHLFDGRFDGLLWCRPDVNDETLKAINNSPIPVVAMHVPPSIGLEVPSYCCDNLQALEIAVSHLRDLGHERIAFASDFENRTSVEGRARAEAFSAAMLSRKLPIDLGDLLVWDHEGADLPRYWADGP